jgi:hypothetical protein
MFAKNLTADRETDAGSARPFGGFENIEDGVALIFRYSRAVITDGNEHHIGGAIKSGLDNDSTTFDALDRVNRIGDDIKHGAVNTFSIEQSRGNIVARAEFDSDSGFGSPRCGKFGDFRDDMIELSILQRRDSVLAETKHIHHEVIDAGLVAFHDSPALANQRFLFLIESHRDEMAATTDTLQNILDVVAEHCDCLAHRREPLGAKQSILELPRLKCKCRLPRNCDNRSQMLVCKPPTDF